MNALSVLVIDDDEDFADGVSEFLELEGLRVTVARSGEAGVEACARNTYDAILIDIGLPGINGVECLTQIRQTTPDARCFLLTGYSADHIADQGIEAGAIEILTKPIKPDELMRHLGADGGSNH